MYLETFDTLSYVKNDRLTMKVHGAVALLRSYLAATKSMFYDTPMGFISVK